MSYTNISGDKMEKKQEKLLNSIFYQIDYLYKGKQKKVIVCDESKNLSGSIKIRPAKRILDEAYKKGVLTKDKPICEVTSGNMGIALATLAKAYGNRIIICMPKFASKERIDILKQLGAKLILTESFDEAFIIAKKLEEKGVFLTRQFENIDNAKSYILLCKDLEKYISFFPALILGVGTGGTLNGMGNFLKNKYQTEIYAIEPLQTLILSTGISHGKHRIEGLSDGLIPKLYPKEIVDKIYSIDDTDAICMAQKLKETLGIGVGISSGANFLGAVLTGVDGIITIFADDDTKYQSTDLTNFTLKSKIVDDIKLLSIKQLYKNK